MLIDNQQIKPNLIQDSSIKGIGKVKTSFLNKLKLVISQVDCSLLCELPKGKEFQKEKRLIIKQFQENLTDHLKLNFKNISWVMEESICDTKKDSCDILGTLALSDNQYKILIELDTIRADQVAKKFVSRFALTMDKSIIYVALCYPGTNKMNVVECKKYFEFCSLISQSYTKTPLEKFFIGFLIESN